MSATTQPRERPILFQGAMVRAILAGTKTQTRRAWREQPPVGVRVGYVPGETQTPYGQVGDLLVVRETFFALGRWETRFSAKKGRDEWHFHDMTLELGEAYQFTAPPSYDKTARRRAGATPQWHRRPAIFMPRAASRILLEIAEVRVERLQDISEEDAMAEGVNVMTAGTPTNRDAYRYLWDEINGRGAWDLNPWVFAISFRRL